MKKILIHTSTRGFRIEEPLIHAGYSVTGIPERMAKNHKFLKLLNLINIMIKENPDLILVDSAGLMCISAYFLSRLFRVPLVLRMRADIWAIHEEQKEYYRITRRVYELILLKICETIFKRATRLFPVSRHLKEVMKEKGIEEDKIRIIRLAIDHKRFHPVRKEGKSIRLLSVANLAFKRKTEGLIDILPVIDEVISKYGDVYYQIAGRGRFSKFLKEKLKNLKNKDKIFYLGYQKDIEMQFSKADIFVQYSYLDAYPATVLEAMASGVPVIANRYGGMIEQIENGITGFLVDDVSSFREVLEQLIEDKKMRENMGERGRSFVLERLDISVIAECYKKEIDVILEP